MKQILVIVPFPMSNENLAMRKQQLGSVQLSNDMEFTFRPVKAGPKNYISEADMVLADITILEAGLTAELEGFDAVCVDTMSDSGVAALRSTLSIPVVGPGRASMLTAMMLGQRFSIVTMWRKWFHLYEKIEKDLGLQAHLASMRSIDVAPDNQALLGGKEDDIFPLLEKSARQAIDEDGADVILLGSTTMHQAHAYLSSVLEVPVINPGPLTYKMVESLLGLGLSHSSVAYPKSPVPRDKMLHAMLKAAGDFDH
jgi:allantoin racemase